MTKTNRITCQIRWLRRLRVNSRRPKNNRTWTSRRTYPPQAKRGKPWLKWRSRHLRWWPRTPHSYPMRTRKKNNVDQLSSKINNIVNSVTWSLHSWSERTIVIFVAGHVAPIAARSTRSRMLTRRLILIPASPRISLMVWWNWVRNLLKTLKTSESVNIVTSSRRTRRLKNFII